MRCWTRSARADGGCTGPLVAYCLTTLALILAIVKRSDDMRGFVVLPKRWIVERFFAHLMRTRRLVRDFERRGFVHFQRQRLSICLSSSECPASP